MIRSSVVWAARRLGYDVWRVPTRARGRQWRDADFYRPFFSPWLGFGEFARDLEAARPYTVVTPDRLYVLSVLLQNALLLHGEVWECGVYRGGTARMFARILGEDNRPLRLFDTFAGLPEPDQAHDIIRAGGFGDASLEGVQAVVGPRATYHAGRIPDTFGGLEETRISFAHVDVDLYASVRDCCAFIWPRLVPGGVLVFDDYGGQTTPGARAAVDGFFADRLERPLILSTGQALVWRTRDDPAGTNHGE